MQRDNKPFKYVVLLGLDAFNLPIQTAILSGFLYLLKKIERFREIQTAIRQDQSFDDYFDIEWDSGKLMPNTDASPEDSLEELYKFNDSKTPSIDRFSYRFFLERGLFSTTTSQE